MLRVNSDDALQRSKIYKLMKENVHVECNIKIKIYVLYQKKLVACNSKNAAGQHEWTEPYKMVLQKVAHTQLKNRK